MEFHSKDDSKIADWHEKIALDKRSSLFVRSIKTKKIGTKMNEHTLTIYKYNKPFLAVMSKWLNKLACFGRGKKSTLAFSF